MSNLMARPSPGPYITVKKGWAGLYYPLRMYWDEGGWSSATDTQPNSMKPSSGFRDLDLAIGYAKEWAFQGGGYNRGPIPYKQEQPMTLKLEVGKTYLSRGGVKVKIHALAVTSTGYNLIGEYLGKGSIARWNQDGKTQFVGDSKLVSEYKEPEYRWFNVYSGWVTNFFHETREKALNGPRSTPHGPLDGNYVGTYRIDLNTGDIMKEEG